MKKILIIGAGNIGFWHLNGILNSKIEFRCYIFDSKPKQINNFKKRLNFKRRNIIFVNKLQKVPKKLDFVIFATCSKGRYNLVKKIIKNFSVTKILLEKVVEQSLDNLNKLNALSKKIDIYISLPFRCSKFFKILKNKKKNKLFFIVQSARKDLACNSIHFLDIMSWILSKKVKTIDTSKILLWFDSNRKGFKEFIGSVKFIFDDKSILSLKNVHSDDKSFMKIFSGKNEYQILDYYEKIKINNKKIIKSNNLSISKIMGTEINKIMNYKKSNLPKYEDIYYHHYYLIKYLLMNYNNINRTRLKSLPIT